MVLLSSHFCRLLSGIYVIPCLDALSHSLERLDLSLNHIALVDCLDALVGLREIDLSRNEM